MKGLKMNDGELMMECIQEIRAKNITPIFYDGIEILGYLLYLLTW